MRTWSWSWSGAVRVAAAVAGLAAATVLVAGGGAAASNAYVPCRAGDVTTTFVPGSGGSGWHGTTLRLTNASDHECFLYGWPGLQFTDADGVPSGIPVTDDGAAFGVGIGPGGQLDSEWFWPYLEGDGEVCPTVPARVVVTLPGGSTLNPLPWPGGAICDGGVDVSAFTEPATA